MRIDFIFECSDLQTTLFLFESNHVLPDLQLFLQELRPFLQTASIALAQLPILYIDEPSVLLLLLCQCLQE
jgi:hypothetical protein